MPVALHTLFNADINFAAIFTEPSPHTIDSQQAAEEAIAMTDYEREYGIIDNKLSSSVDVGGGGSFVAPASNTELHVIQETDEISVTSSGSSMLWLCTMTGLLCCIPHSKTDRVAPLNDVIAIAERHGFM